MSSWYPRAACSCDTKAASHRRNSALSVVPCRSASSRALDLPDRKIHRPVSGAGAGSVADRVEGDEAELFIEGHAVGQGIHEQPHTAHPAPPLQRQQHHVPHKGTPEPPALVAQVQRQARQAKNRERIVRQSAPVVFRKPAQIEQRCAHRCVRAYDAMLVNGHIGSTHVVPELVLSGVPTQEIVERRVSAIEVVPTIRPLERATGH